MEIWLASLLNVFSPVALMLIAGGALAGVMLGAIPGLNSPMGTALLIPFTFAMEPANGLMLLTAVYCGGTFGGSISAILFNVPGAPEASVTGFDGYPMAKSGKAGKALGIAIMCSCLGGLFSVIVMSLISPQLASVALSFSEPEYFALALAALTLIASLGGDKMIKAFIAGCIGLLAATIGIDPMTSAERFTFDGDALMGGINFIPALIGAFAVGEILMTAEAGLKKTGEAVTKVSTELPKIIELLKLKWTILRSAVIGTMIGILPGVGATTAAFVGYSEAVRWSKHPRKFGTGIAEGIAAPETCNNAAAGGAMVPLLTLGIPGSATTAVIIGGFMVHGMQPGPMLFINQPGLMYSLFIAMFVANIFMLFSGMIVAKLFSNFRKIRYSILGPCIFVFATVGAFGISNSMVDVWIMFAFGLIGYAMKKFDFPIAPLIIALVLGELAEISLRRGMRMADWDISDFIFRPIGGTILLLTLITLLFTIYGKVKRKSKFVDSKTA
ncbi:MAG: tripartite tricarboxylate transporter permease [Deltaproteobacteria bacterium]|uniref:tripartite tricarboxylate transporter permease n=1 Tax=Desulfobacula sp. TaxID=2593537 RepID=UPI001995C260|nr:tripartite tricarboxylate transporter permease [Candidatus Desulfobacula maris]MBL6992455.1 tripartite tricarboxylate transporter permease [Desulfobacula sp.]